MVQRLLLDGINVDAARLAVHHAVKHALLILPHLAVSEIARLDAAELRAKLALSEILIQLFVVRSLFHTVSD
jgi:hypothetical protein